MQAPELQTLSVNGIQMRVATQVSGGGAMIQSMARSMGSGEEWLGGLEVGRLRELVALEES